MLNVSEIKKNKAGKVTAAYKLVLLNLPQKAVDWRSRDGNGRGRERNLGMVLRNLTGKGVAGDVLGSQSLLCFENCDIRCVYLHASPVSFFHAMFESLFANFNSIR